MVAQDLGDYFRVPPDLRDLNYGKFVELGDTHLSEVSEYNSHNTNRLGEVEMRDLLMKLDFIKSAVLGEFGGLEV